VFLICSSFRGKFFKNSYGRFILFYMAFAAYFQFSAEVAFQILVEGVVLFMNAERCFEPCLGFTVGTKSIVGVGKLLGNELLLFSGDARALVPTTFFTQQRFYAARRGGIWFSSL
jgi:hypothetical protein